MSLLSSLDDLMESKLLTLHTAYLARVIETSADGTKAKIQPLTMFKEYGKEAKLYAVIPDVPILNHARWKVESKAITFVTDVSITTSGAQGYLTDVLLQKKTQTEHFAVLSAVSSGDIVFCVCAERDISEAKKGNISVPNIGRHSLSDSVIVGVLT